MICDLPRQQLSSSFCPQESGHFAQAQIQFLDGTVAIAQAGVELAFAQRENVGPQLEALLVEFGEAGVVVLFQSRTAFAFLERLHPEGFGDVGHRFW
jgi:hypothetical protein